MKAAGWHSILRYPVLLLPVCLVALVAGASSPTDPQAKTPAAVASSPGPGASIEKQKASVQAQREAARQPAGKAAEKPLEADEFLPPMSGTADEFITPLLPPPPPVRANCPPLPPSDVDTLVSAAAQKQNLKAALIRAVMKQESGFMPCAVSVKGAQGLMQLMPETAERFHVSDPFDPKQNVDAGAALLRQLLDKYKGDVSLTLGAYNAGANSVDASGAIPDLTETKNYVASILAELGDSQEAPKN